MEVRWTAQAVSDLTAIRKFIGRDSATYARLVIEQLFEAADQLRTFPDSGRVVPERDDPEIREVVRPPFRIVYRRSSDLVEILTVHHSARSFPVELDGEDESV